MGLDLDPFGIFYDPFFFVSWFMNGLIFPNILNMCHSSAGFLKYVAAQVPHVALHTFLTLHLKGV